MKKKIRVKICCIESLEEARLAIDYGADALGLVSAMPSGPGVIPDDLIGEIASSIPPSVSSFLLTSKQDIKGIIEQQNRFKVNTIQICDRLINGTHKELKNALPGTTIVQVIHVTGNEALNAAIKTPPEVDAILLDSGNQNLEVKKLGGTGSVHNWDISADICKSINKPVFLAGGLNPENVQSAIRKINPFGVDVCSGVRENGKLSEEKLKAFFEAVNSIN